MPWFAAIPLVILFGASAFPARAALSYSRTPNATSYVDGENVSLALSMASLADLGCGDRWQWIIAGRSKLNKGDFLTALANTFSTNLPVDRYFYVAVGAYEGTTFCKRTFLEIGPPGTDIFVVDPRRPNPTSIGRVQYRPAVSLTSPAAEGLVFGSDLNVEYRASDENDASGLAGEFGLGPGPVSLFYSESVDALDGRLIPQDKKTLIASSLPAIGQYRWDTKELPEGDRYRLIADVQDLAGDVGEAVSPTFALDHTPPVFEVRAEPPVSRREDVTLTVTPSEELLEPPKLDVLQRGLGPVPVSLQKDGSRYVGVYRVIGGADGTASVLVSGRDRALNEGTKIVAGGTFSVGIEPPPPPIVLAPLDGEILASSTLTVSGKAREDTTVVLTLNGGASYEALSDSDGNFSFGSIPLDMDANRGVNFLNIVSRDAAGNVSEAVSLRVKFNVAPELSIVAPSSGDTLAASSTIRFQARDANRDRLAFSIETSGDNGSNWSPLVASTTNREFVWDTTKVPDGQYLIRVSADDGSAVVRSTAGPFRVSNSLPVISFADGPRTVSNRVPATVRGTVESPDASGVRHRLAGLEYRIEGVGDWTGFETDDGAADSFRETFTLALEGLEERAYEMAFRARDERGLYGFASKTLIVDFGPPPSPVVHAPRPQAVISDDDDQNAEVAGVQFALSGTAEPLSRTAVLVDGAWFEARSAEDGAYALDGVTVRRHGINRLELVSRDAAGNQSATTTLEVAYNNPPILKFRSPRHDRAIGGRAVVRWEVRDPDGDSIRDPSLGWRRGKDQPFIPLSINPAAGEFSWDIRSFPEAAGYELRLEAGDGVSRSEERVSFAVDHTAPAIALDPLPKTAFRQSFVLTATGRASDNFSGVEFVEYSIDGAHWYKAIITSGFLTGQAAFRMTHPFRLADGTYTIRFRSVDAAGNESIPQTAELLVDTTPPRIGAYRATYGGFTLYPESGNIRIPEGHTLRFALSLESDAHDATLKIYEVEPRKISYEVRPREIDSSIQLAKNPATGLWTADLDFSSLGTFTLSTHVTDALGNATTSPAIAAFEVVSSGRVRSASAAPAPAIAGAAILVEMWDAERQRWQPWPAEAYGVQNPTTTKDDGAYNLILPSGRYRLLLRRSGFERIRTSPFNLPAASFVTSDFTMQPRGGLRGRLEDFWEQLFD